MKSKSTNNLISLAAMFSLLALIVRLVVFCGPQKFFVELCGGGALTEDYSNVSDPIGITKAIIFFVFYLIVCIITVVNKRKASGKIAGFVCIVVQFISNLLSPIITATVVSIFINNQGAKYLATYSYLSNIASSIQSSFTSAASILLCITLGTLMGKDENEQQNY